MGYTGIENNYYIDFNFREAVAIKLLFDLNGGGMNCCWALCFILHSAKPSGNEGSRQQQSLQFSSFEREITLFLAPLEFSTKKKHTHFKNMYKFKIQVH